MSRQIITPFEQFFDSDGTPLDNGSVYIGTANLNPETNPVQVYWDDARTIPAAQPIKTSNGYMVRNGTPAQVFANVENYSMTVKDKKGRIVWTVMDATSVSELSGSGGAALVGFIQSGTGAVQRTIQDKNREMVSITDFGAVSGGGVDNTLAIQKSLDASYAVFVPEGEFLFTKVSVRDGTTLYGLGRKSVLLGDITTTGSHINIIGSGYPAGKITRVTVRDLMLYSNSSTANCFNLENVEFATFQNVVSVNGYSGFRMDRVESIDFIHCHAVASNGYGFVSSRTQDEGINSWVTLVDAFVSGAFLGGMLFTDTASVSLTNPKVINCKDFGIKANVSAGKIGTVRCSAFKCEGGDIDSNWNTSIYLSDQTEFTIASTWVSGGRTSNQSSLNVAGYGIFVNNSKNGEIVNPKIYACGNQGIRFQGSSEKINILGGHVIGCGNDAGIYSNAGDYIKVIGTTLLPSDGSGFTQTKGIDLSTGNYHVVTSCTSVGHSSFNYNVNGVASKTIFNANVNDEVLNAGSSLAVEINRNKKLYIDANTVRPVVDNSMYFGLSAYRWKEIWAANAVIQTSDANQKVDVIDEPLGLDFINSLKPVQYKFVDNNGVPRIRPHHGLIAQEFKGVLDKFNIDHAAYVENNNEDGTVSYGLRYCELISSLIKSVQDIDKKLESMVNK